MGVVVKISPVNHQWENLVVSLAEYGSVTVSGDTVELAPHSAQGHDEAMDFLERREIEYTNEWE